MAAFTPGGAVNDDLSSLRLERREPVVPVVPVEPVTPVVPVNNDVTENYDIGVIDPAALW
jgi:hypothetical protein